MTSTWPVALRIEGNIQRLALADFAPGSPIMSFEIQQLTALDGALTFRVLVKHADHTIDYYWPPEHPLPVENASIGAGVGHSGPISFDRARLDVGPGGLALDVALTDVRGNRFELTARSDRPWRGFRLAAPLSYDSREPHALFYPYLGGFGLVSSASLTVSASYGGSALSLLTMPVPYEGGRLTSVKAATEVTILELLPDGAPPLTLADPLEGVRLDVDGEGRLRRVTSPGEVGDAVVACDPPLPPAEAIHTEATHRWNLRLSGDLLAAGTLHLRPSARGGIDVAYLIDTAWKGAGPGAGAVARLITRTVPIFRWARAYSWRGHLTTGDEPRLTGRWVNGRFRNPPRSPRAAANRP